MTHLRPLGSYLARDTVLHRLDVRVKFVLLILIASGLFIVPGWMSLLFFALLLFSGFIVVRVGLRTLVHALRPCGLVFLFVLFANGFVCDTTGTIVLFGPCGISVTGLARGAFALSRVFLLVGYALLFAATTSVTSLVDGLSSFVRPLEALKLPGTDIIMTISIAMRFLPVCIATLQRIRLAQRARGANFFARGLLRRFRTWLSVLVPLIVALFQQSDELAQALRDRCYGATKRTYLVRQLRKADIVVLIGGIAFWVVLCVMRVSL